jgi:hypothetical protein
MSRAVRRSVLTAAVFALAAIGGAVGNHLSHRLDAAAISFLVLLLLGTGAAVWLDRLNSTSTTRSANPHLSSSSRKRDQSGGGASENNVLIKRGKGSQIGNGNVQINSFGSPHERRDRP